MIAFKHTRQVKACITEDFPIDLKSRLEDEVLSSHNFHLRLVSKKWQFSIMMSYLKARQIKILFHIPSLPSSTSDFGVVRDYNHALKLSKKSYNSIKELMISKSNFNPLEFVSIHEISPKCIIVVRTKRDVHKWFVRIEHENKFALLKDGFNRTLLALTSGFCDELLSHIFKSKEMRKSSLVLEFQPTDQDVRIDNLLYNWRRFII